MAATEWPRPEAAGPAGSNRGGFPEGEAIRRDLTGPPQDASKNEIGELPAPPNPMHGTHTYRAPWTASALRMLLRERAGTIPAREELMLNLSKVIHHLKQERDQTRARLDQLDTALKVLENVGTAGRRSGRGATSAKRRTMSASARRRLAVAQRARWAKWKAAQKKK